MGRVSKVEVAKAESGYLRGTVPEELDGPEDHFSHDAAQVLKFHGVYQQDDRDVRRERLGQGLGRDYLCMVRAGIPGGILSAEQYLVMDRLADQVGNGTLRITTRQGIQYHFTRKGDLRTLIGTLNRHLVTTLAACGDVVRNVTCCPAPLPDREGTKVQAYTRTLSRKLKPRSRAYWSLWVDGERAVTAEAPATEEEPLYGPTYLPRKFKVGLAFPGDNCIDVYSHDLGVVPTLQGGHLTGFTVLVGGGLGMSHGDESTFPRLASPLGWVEPPRLLPAARAVVSVQRDHGNRSDRKHARLKYLVEDRGLEWFRTEVEARLGEPLAPAPEPEWTESSDHLGWHAQRDGRWFLGVRVEAGRIKDDGEARVRSALRTLVDLLRPGVRFTPRQDVLLTDLLPEDRPLAEAVLVDHGVPLADELLPVVRGAMACPALPTCGLALTEAERVLPEVIGTIRAELAALGLEREAVEVRMTGCPNGCARPYTAEVGVVGRTKTAYALFVGGDRTGTRLGTLVADHVPRGEVAATLRPLLARWAAERAPGEGFGDYCHRVGPLALAEVGEG